MFRKPKAEDQEDKPKYDKSLDFFDSITNSSLEKQRGGYRGRGRGRKNFDNDWTDRKYDNDRGDRGGFRGDGEGFNRRGGRGGGEGRGRGRGYRNDYGDDRRERGGRGDGDFGGFRQNNQRRNLYSKGLADPNHIDYGKTEEGKEPEDGLDKGFYDKKFKKGVESGNDRTEGETQKPQGNYKDAEEAFRMYNRNKHSERRNEDGGFRGGRNND
jgi:hypothetical protein